jgi:hypothetical protein
MGTDLVPLFLADHAEEPDVPAMLRAWDRAFIASRILKTGILFLTTAAIVLAVLSAGNPLELFAKARASLIGTSLIGASAPQDSPGQLPLTIRSTADGQSLPPTSTDVPNGDETASAPEAADQSQIEIRQQPVENLLRQFQAWATEKDAGATARR